MIEKTQQVIYFNQPDPETVKLLWRLDRHTKASLWVEAWIPADKNKECVSDWTKVVGAEGWTAVRGEVMGLGSKLMLREQDTRELIEDIEFVWVHLAALHGDGDGIYQA